MNQQNQVFLSKDKLSDPEVWQYTQSFKDDVQAFKIAIEMLSDIKLQSIIRVEPLAVSTGARYTFVAIPEDPTENRRLVDIISLKYKTGSVSVLY